MSLSVESLIEAYDPTPPLSHASTPPSGWYTDSRIETLEAEGVFATSWQLVARVEQIADNGQFVSTDPPENPSSSFVTASCVLFTRCAGT